MLGNRSYIFKGLYFILLSVFLAALFTILFGIKFGFEHPFFNLPIFIVFLGIYLLLAIIVYLFSFKENFKDETRQSAGRTMASVLIMVLALLVSAVFPAVSFLGLYPVTMAMFHFLILFYAGISVAALSLSGMLTLLRNKADFSTLNKTIFIVSIIISLAVSYMSIFLFGLLPAS